MTSVVTWRRSWRPPTFQRICLVNHTVHRLLGNQITLYDTDEYLEELARRKYYALWIQRLYKNVKRGYAIKKRTSQVHLSAFRTDSGWTLLYTDMALSTEDCIINLAVLKPPVRLHCWPKKAVISFSPLSILQLICMGWLGLLQKLDTFRLHWLNRISHTHVYKFYCIFLTT